MTKTGSLLLEVTMCLNSLAFSREAKDLFLFYDLSYPFEAKKNKRVIATSARFLCSFVVTTQILKPSIGLTFGPGTSGKWPERERRRQREGDTVGFCYTRC